MFLIQKTCQIISPHRITSRHITHHVASHHITSHLLRPLTRTSGRYSSNQSFMLTCSLFLSPLSAAAEESSSTVPADRIQRGGGAQQLEQSQFSIPSHRVDNLKCIEASLSQTIADCLTHGYTPKHLILIYNYFVSGAYHQNLPPQFLSSQFPYYSPAH